MPKYQKKRTQKPTYPINNTEQGIEIPHEISEDASGIANIEILTISKHSTYSNHYVKKNPTENPHLLNIYYIPHNSKEHTTNYCHQYYTHHGDGKYQGFGNGMQQSFGNGMQHQYPVYQTVPKIHHHDIKTL